MNFTERFQNTEGVHPQERELNTPTPQQPHPELQAHKTAEELLSLFQGESLEELLELDHYESSLSLWEEVLSGPTRSFLSAPGKSLRRDFVELGWRLASTLSQGTRTPCPPALPHLIELLHSGSLIVDDIEDQSLTRRGQPCLHRQIGLAPALNIGNWLYFVSAQMLERLECPLSTRATLYARLNRVMLRCHQGQALDVSCQVTSYARAKLPKLTSLSTRLKTGVLVGFALQLGGLAQDLSAESTAMFYRFGERMGLALQMYDDLSGFLSEAKWHKGREDMSRQRLTWVWAWLAQEPTLTDHEFSELMSELKALNTLGEGTHQPQTQGEHSAWEARAVALRDRCRPLLSSAEQKIKAEVQSALEELAVALQNDEAYLIATRAVARLQRSYL